MAEPESTHEVAEATKRTPDGGVVKERTEKVSTSTTETNVEVEGEAKQVKPDGR